VELVYSELGAGQPLVLLHGLFSSAHINWMKYGTAERLAAAGFRVLMPDLRAHGRSGKPHEASAYPKSVLVQDGLALLTHLGLEGGDYILGGFSLGARTALSMVLAGAEPRRLLVCGMGLEGLLGLAERSQFFRHVLDNPGSFKQGTREWFTEAFLKSTHGDVVALRLLLNSFAPIAREQLEALALPITLICGADDHDNGSAQALADALPDAELHSIPGTHMGSVTKPEFAAALLAAVGG
jgi:pimeloyl-ACP methyl ester carboxylesterase